MKTLFFLTSFILSLGYTQAQIVDIPDANFKNYLLNHDSTIIDINGDSEIQLSEAEDFQGSLQLYADITDITGIEAFIKITGLYIYKNSTLTSLDISKNTQLMRLHIDGQRQLATLDLSKQIKLEWFWYNSNYENFTLDISKNINLTHLNCSFSSLDFLDVSHNPKLKTLDCRYNNITLLNVSKNHLLETLSCGNNDLSSLNLSFCPELSDFNCSGISHLYLKNNNSNWDYYGILKSNGSTIKYMCVNDFDIDQVNTVFTQHNITDCIVNSFCPYPEDNLAFNISGKNIFDQNGNGCDENDTPYPNLKYAVNNDTTSGHFISDNSGEYIISLGEGAHTLTAKNNDLGYYTITPTQIDVDFPTTESHFIQDFCISADGTHNDLEVALIPIERARPGFDVDYKLVYKNKGNTTLSGQIVLEYANEIMDLEVSNPMVSSETDSSLLWDFEDLKPFEKREIRFTMNINSPLEVPEVNGNDTLTFTTSIEVLNDGTPDDNSFELRQRVVNSFDPNDKTCLEGKTITPQMVGDYVHYMIRFENTGTAEAVNIIVRDTINMEQFDVNSIELTDQSHTCRTIITQNVVEFKFDNINLPFEDATNDGYITFKIKTLPTLELGDTFENTAGIYFDFNHPIITNTSSTEIAIIKKDDVVAGIKNTLTINDVQIYPNPAQDFLAIESNESIESIDIYTINGALIKKVAYIGDQTSTKINLTELKNGVYIATVKTKKGVFTEKILVE